MPAIKSNDKTNQSELGSLLRGWRDLRGVSQLDLSLDAGVSQRHLSFIESGRSVPSRDMLTAIAQSLDVPLRERNALFQAAGYASVYMESAIDALEMSGIRKALERMLEQHAPFPAVVMDRYWNVLMANDAAPRFFNHFIDMSARKGTRNMLHLMFDPAGMRPFIAQWESLSASLIQRVHRESIGRVVDEKTQSLLAGLRAYPDTGGDLKNLPVADITPSMPMIPVGFVKDGRVLNYFSMITTVGTPQTIAAQELRLECMFPADDETERHHLAMMERV